MALIPVALGLGVGYQLVTVGRKEEEVAQGGGAYMAATCQAAQLSTLTNVTSNFVMLYPFRFWGLLCVLPTPQFHLPFFHSPCLQRK